MTIGPSIVEPSLLPRLQEDLRAPELLARGSRATETGGARGDAPAAGANAVDTSDPLYRAATEFEALFVKQMLSAMRKTVPKGGLLQGGLAKDIFEDMLYDEYAKQIAVQVKLGIAEQMYRQFSSPQR